MTLVDTGTQEIDAKFHYICTLVHGEELRQFDLFFAHTENTDTSLTVDYLLKGLALYFLPVIFLLKKKRTMRRCIKKTLSLKVGHYAARLIDLNEYLASFPGKTIYNKISVTELNGVILNSMPTSWSKQEFVQGFHCKYISLKKAINMFERMIIAEIIYEGVVTSSY